MKKEIVLTKLERQLLMYDIFYHCTVIEFVEITNLLPINKKMIERDVKDLTDAGLISVTFSKKENGYIHSGEPKFCETETNERRKEHLTRLARLATLMRELDSNWSDEHEEDLELLARGGDDEDPDLLEYLEETKDDYYTAVESYYEIFPDLPEDAWKQDFEVLENIGYTFYRTERGNYRTGEMFNHYYCGQMLLEDFGVRRREDGKLVRRE